MAKLHPTLEVEKSTIGDPLVVGMVNLTRMLEGTTNNHFFDLGV